MKKIKKITKISFIILLIIAVLISITIIVINAYIINRSSGRIISEGNASQLEDIDCILVLGCGVRDDGRPSIMLTDRLNKGIELYKNNVSQKILMSGDHGTLHYDEVNTMKQYAIDCGVPSYDVFMDHAGFSTYDSMYRAIEIFEAKNIIIVTQKYHLYRALHIAHELGLNAYGVDAASRDYPGQTIRELREILARNKDYFVTLFKPLPVCLGEAIPVSGNGNATNDKEFY